MSLRSELVAAAADQAEWYGWQRQTLCVGNTRAPPFSHLGRISSLYCLPWCSRLSDSAVRCAAGHNRKALFLPRAAYEMIRTC